MLRIIVNFTYNTDLAPSIVKFSRLTQAKLIEIKLAYNGNSKTRLRLTYNENSKKSQSLKSLHFSDILNCSEERKRERQREERERNKKRQDKKELSF